MVATCDHCGQPLLWLREANGQSYDLPDDWPDTLQTSVFVGDHERRLHWKCYEAELSEPQEVMFG